MEETEIGEVGVDKLGDEVREQVREIEEKKEQASRWMRWLALSTAIFAVLAAIASLRSGQLANEALLEMNEATLKQSAAADSWAYYQAKGIEQVTRASEANILAAVHSPEAAIEQAQNGAAHYQNQQQEIQQEAKKLEQERDEMLRKSNEFLEQHHTFAYAVTALQIAIGLSAIAALMSKQSVWWFALATGAIGSPLLMWGFLR